MRRDIALLIAASLLLDFVFRGGGGSTTAAPGTAASGTTYYFSTRGSDSNSGTSPSSPWQTITRFNAGPPGGWAAGMTAAFAAGQTFVPSSTCSGTAGNMYLARNAVEAPTINISTTNPPTFGRPLMITGYGAGAAPVIVSSCPGTDHGTAGPNSIAVLIDGVSNLVWNGVDVSANGTTTQYGLLVQNSSYASVSNITIENSSFTGFHLDNGATASYSAELEFSAMPLSETRGTTCARISNVNVLNDVLGGASGVRSADDNGLVLGENGSSGAICSGLMDSTLPLSNFTVAGLTIFDLGGRGAASPTSKSDVSAMIVWIRNSLFEYNLSHDTSYNGAHCNGMAYVAWQSYNNILQFNETYNNYPHDGGRPCDVGAYDIDADTASSIVQYNYSHNNAGAGLMVYVGVEGAPSLPWNNNVIRYNISENDAGLPAGNSRGSITLEAAGAAPSPPATAYIYNNTVYQSSTKTTVYGVWSVNSGNLYNNFVIANNIIGVVADTRGHNKFVSLNNGSANVGPRMMNNAYWSVTPGTFYASGNNGHAVYDSLSAWQAAVSGDEAGATTMGPVLAGTPPNGRCSWTPSWNGPGPQACPADYKLTRGASAYIGTGLNLTASPYRQSVGTRDYYGDPIPNGVGTGYNIGADGGTP